ncbi:MAG: hypothetical protein MjAS7_2842 [Metallosphaera javensis (ex Sakai et al. 2022)]|nr:MAG: hypothetical protein MjAS7_2842 [Metallosphaera javensis (ex Sakai et al. 2022)]
MQLLGELVEISPIGCHFKLMKDRALFPLLYSKLKDNDESS